MPEARLAIKTVPWREQDLDGAIRSCAGQDVAALGRQVDMVAPMAFTHVLRQTPEWKRALLAHVKAVGGKPVVSYVQTEKLYRDEAITPEQFEAELTRPSTRAGPERPSSSTSSSLPIPWRRRSCSDGSRPRGHRSGLCSSEPDADDGCRAHSPRRDRDSEVVRRHRLPRPLVATPPPAAPVPPVEARTLFAGLAVLASPVFLGGTGRRPVESASTARSTCTEQSARGRCVVAARRAPGPHDRRSVWTTGRTSEDERP